MPKRYPTKRRTPAQRKHAKKAHSHEWLAAGIIVAVIMVVAHFLEQPQNVSKQRSLNHPQQSRKAHVTSEKKSKPTRKEERKKEVTRSGKIKRIAIVIDDLGQSMEPARELIALGAEITFSILPNLEHSEDTAQLAGDNGHDVLLHMPMERKNRDGKGEEEGTLHSNMTPQEFTSAMQMHIDSVPGAIGINNHEGSALTENSEAMKFLMAELKARDLTFLDSVTAPKSIAYATAKEFGLRAVKRDVFLDNYQDQPGYIRGQLDELARTAKKRGSAVGIGHPYGTTLAELKAWIPEVQKQGIAIVPLSQLMK